MSVVVVHEFYCILKIECIAVNNFANSVWKIGLKNELPHPV